jgi:uncharacterized protein with LGFP repeats
MNNPKMRSLTLTAAAVLVAGAALTGCSQTKDAASSATSAAGQAAAAATSAAGAAVGHATSAAGAAGSAAASAVNGAPTVTSTEIASPSGAKITLSGGPILDAYAKAGYEKGTLGAPLGPISPLPGEQGKFLTLEHGSIYWSEATGAHVVSGAIGDKWGTLSHERGKLGFPTSDATTENGATVQKFQHGTITEKGSEVTVSDS